jgi:hypothetical protein
MGSTTKYVGEGRDHTAPVSPDERVPDGRIDAPRELSPLGGESSDQAPRYRERRVVIAIAGSTPHPQGVV